VSIEGQMGVCKGCGAPILWRRTPEGKSMPCDPGEVTIVLLDGRVTHGLIPHWATRPKAGDFKKRATGGASS
jgi:hypothetical protein